MEEIKLSEKQLFSKAPWWGQAVTIVYTLGPLTVGFFLFIAVLFGWLPSPMLTAIQNGTRATQGNYTLLEGINKAVIDHTEDSRRMQKSTLQALRSICRNTAKTIITRDQCDELYGDGHNH